MKIGTKHHFIGVSNFDEHYITKTLNQVEINRARLISDANDVKCGRNTDGTRKLIYKINSAIVSENYGNISINDIIEKILDGDKIYQGRFMINPKRQNGKKEGAELIQIDYIQNKINGFYNVNIVKLPSKGVDSYRIVNGEIVRGAEKNINTTKSFDVQILNDCGKSIFLINKVTCSIIEETNDYGGSQSNQLELSEKHIMDIDFTNDKYKDTYIILLFDGKFYKNNSYVLQLIEKYSSNKHIYITTSDGIKEILGTILYN
jgi:hypothetical protein